MDWHRMLFTDIYDLWDMGMAFLGGILAGMGILANHFWSRNDK